MTNPDTTDRPLHKVLLVLSNPYQAPPLALGQEVRAIYESIRLSGRSTTMEILPLFAATIHDLRRALLREQFTVVHFLGHGSTEGLVFENELGEAHVPPIPALARLFAAQRSLQCVLLNACDTANQGKIAAEWGVPCVIAMDGAIHDKAAIEFSRGFYDALAAGREIQRAHTEGLSTVDLSIHGKEPFKAELFIRPVVCYLFVLLGENDFHRIPLYKPVTLLGREDDPEDTDCDVLLPRAYVRVSHRHAKLSIADRRVFLEDAASIYGTYVDGQLIHDSPTLIFPNQVITLGGHDSSTPGVCGLRVSWHKYLPT